MGAGVEAQSSVFQAPPWPLQARKSKLYRGPSEGGGSLGRSDCWGGLENAQESRQVGCQFLEGLISEKPQA